MNSSNRMYSLAVSLVLAFSLLLAGCGSTGSDSDSNTNNNNSGTSATFTSGTVSPDETYSYTFEEEGSTEYYCEFHKPDMQGKVTVSSSAEAAERDTVYMDGMQFNPAQLTVAPSTEVVWINRSELDHTVTSGNPGSNDDNYDDGGY